MTPKKHAIIELKVIYEYTEKIRAAYEDLLSSYEELCKENKQLRRNTGVPSDFESPINQTFKRRKTDENDNNESRQSDVFNNAIQDISSCNEDDIIESTPKVDVTKRDLFRKTICPRTLTATNLKSNDPTIQIKQEANESSLAATFVEPKHVKKSDSPLRSVENQSRADKENQKGALKWISSSFVSPSRVSRSGFISTKSPKTRLSLCKSFKQSTLDFEKKCFKNEVKKQQTDTCAETFFEGTPPKQPLPKIKPTFLRQQCLENCTSASKDLDDDKVFVFRSNLNPPKAPTITPPQIKQEEFTGQAKKLTSDNEITDEKSQRLDGCSPSSSVVELSGQKIDIIVIDESQPLFDECSTENVYENMELKVLSVDPVSKVLGNSEEEVIVNEHLKFCRQCKMIMDSCRHLSLKEKLDMIERCEKKNPIRQDTDSEFWNPRFNPTPDSQKQETLIDDRWVTRDRKF